MYQKRLRAKHISKAEGMVRRKSVKSRQTQQDPRRLISTTHCTVEGEIAEMVSMAVDPAIIAKEVRYDGLNCLATKLDDRVGNILHVNGFRYEIEHLFRITKTEFDARSVYLQRQDRIKSHFAICFIALLLLKAYQKQVNENLPEADRYSTEQIISALAGMDYLYIRGTGYIPAYSASNLRNHCCCVSNMC